METQDIVERLNQRQAVTAEMGSASVVVIPTDHEALEAAAEISRLRAEVERLREALEKLACRHVTVSPLWWQVEARKALEGGE